VHYIYITHHLHCILQTTNLFPLELVYWMARVLEQGYLITGTNRFSKCLYPQFLKQKNGDMPLKL